jgi:hypothetical protein
MSKRTNPLDRVRVAAPCPADWEQMLGDERVRFCGQCSLNVYNLSGMTKREAETLLAKTEGRLCVRYYRRADGTILTRNCPVGLRALKRRVNQIASAALSTVVGFFAGLGLQRATTEKPPVEMTIAAPVMGDLVAPERENYVFQTLEYREPPPVPITGQLVMGRYVAKEIPNYKRPRRHPR